MKILSRNKFNSVENIIFQRLIVVSAECFAKCVKYYILADNSVKNVSIYGVEVCINESFRGSRYKKSFC